MLGINVIYADTEARHSARIEVTPPLPLRHRRDSSIWRGSQPGYQRRHTAKDKRGGRRRAYRRRSAATAYARRVWRMAGEGMMRLLPFRGAGVIGWPAICRCQQRWRPAAKH